MIQILKLLFIKVILVIINELSECIYQINRFQHLNFMHRLSIDDLLKNLLETRSQMPNKIFNF